MEWLQNRLQDPKTLLQLVENLENAKKRVTLEHERNEREGELDDIRYTRGKLDGLKTFFDVIDRMKSSEKQNPAVPGLLGRILKFGERNGPEG